MEAKFTGDKVEMLVTSSTISMTNMMLLAHILGESFDSFTVSLFYATSEMSIFHRILQLEFFIDYNEFLC